MSILSQFETKLDKSVYTAADILTKIKTVDGSGSGLDADLLDGLDSSAFVQTNMTDWVWTSGTQISLTLNNTAAHTSSEIHFNSHVNAGSDFAYIRYDDHNTNYNYWGSTVGKENSALVLGVRNDGTNANSDVIALESPAGIFLNAPNIFVGTKTNAQTIWHAGNDGAGSGLDADLLDGLDSSAFVQTNGTPATVGGTGPNDIPTVTNVTNQINTQVTKQVTTVISTSSASLTQALIYG